MKQKRFRYVVFRISGDEVVKKDVIRTLNALSRDEALEESHRLMLVHFEDNAGLVRCRHTMKERVIELMNGLRSIGGRDVDVKTVGTSGTIKAALSKYIRK